MEYHYCRKRNQSTILTMRPQEDNEDYYEEDEDDYYEEDEDDYYERLKEEQEEQAQEQEIALNCICGAWKIDAFGQVYHVGDCCCGAE